MAIPVSGVFTGYVKNKNEYCLSFILFYRLKVAHNNWSYCYTFYYER